MSEYDVVIIGGGPGGYNAAIRAGQLGLRVACIEGAATLGGTCLTCLNVGCMPSKALLHASELYAAAAGPEFAKLGIEASPTLNLAQMMRQKDDSVAALTKGIEFLFRKNKAEWIKGWGRLAGHGRVMVSAHDGSESEVKAANIVIATGSKPASLPGIDIDNKRILDSTGALSLPEVPKHLKSSDEIFGRQLTTWPYPFEPLIVSWKELTPQAHNFFSLLGYLRSNSKTNFLYHVDLAKRAHVQNRRIMRVAGTTGC